MPSFEQMPAARRSESIPPDMLEHEPSKAATAEDIEDPESAEEMDYHEAATSIPESPLQKTTAAEELEQKYFQEVYREKLAHWRKTKESYKEAKAKYEGRLAEYYQNYSDKSIFGRGAQKLSEWWDGRPEDLSELEEQFASTRAQYAENLESVLQTRGEANEANAEFDAGTRKTKEAFVKRFLTEPRQTQLAIEKENLHTSETVEQAQKVMQLLKKHKWSLRIGAVTVAGVAVGAGAGVAAGMVAGGYRAARIAAGMAGGAAGAKFGDRLGSAAVERAKEQLEETTESVTERFSVADIDTLEQALTEAQSTVDQKERQRKFSIIAGALIGGGSLANLDNLGDAMVSDASAAVPTEGINVPASDEPLPWQTEEATTKPVGTQTMEQTPVAGDELPWKTGGTAAEPVTAEAPAGAGSEVVTGVPEPEEPGDGSITAETVANPAGGYEPVTGSESSDTSTEGPGAYEPITGVPAEAVAPSEEVTVSHRGPDDGLRGPESLQSIPEAISVTDHTIEQGDALWNVTKEAYADQLAGLTEAQQNRVLDGVFDRLRENPELTTELGVKSGNIDLIYQGDTLRMPLLADLITEEIDHVNGGSPEGMEGTVSVAQGDTLWELTHDAYREQLEGLSEAHRNQVLASVMERLRDNPTLVQELGISSGDIDLIYAGTDELQMDTLRPLLEEEVHRLRPSADVPAATPIPSGGGSDGSLAGGIDAAVNEGMAAQAATTETPEPPDESASDAQGEATPTAPDTIPETAPTNAEVEAATAELGLPPHLASEALETYGSVEAFKAVKTAAIEQVVGERQTSTFADGTRYNPVYESLKPIPIALLNEASWLEIEQLNESAMNQFLRETGLGVSEANQADLQAWHDFYQSIMKPDRLEDLGISTTSDMTFDHLFTSYVNQLPGSESYAPVDTEGATELEPPSATSPDIETALQDKAAVALANELGITDFHNDLAKEAVKTYGSVDAFKAAKLEAIEAIAGKQPPTWGGGERFNPVFEELKYTGLESLDDKLLQGSGSLSDAEVDDLLLNNGLDRSESNRADLRNWQSFYQELNASEDIDDLRRPFMTFNDLFTAHLNHVSATSKP